MLPCAFRFFLHALIEVCSCGFPLLGLSRVGTQGNDEGRVQRDEKKTGIASDTKCVLWGAHQHAVAMFFALRQLVPNQVLHLKGSLLFTLSLLDDCQLRSLVHQPEDKRVIHTPPVALQRVWRLPHACVARVPLVAVSGAGSYVAAPSHDNLGLRIEQCIAASWPIHDSWRATSDELAYLELLFVALLDRGLVLDHLSSTNIGFFHLLLRFGKLGLQNESREQNRYVTLSNARRLLSFFSSTSFSLRYALAAFIARATRPQKNRRTARNFVLANIWTVGVVGYHASLTHWRSRVQFSNGSFFFLVLRCFCPFLNVSPTVQAITKLTG